MALEKNANLRTTLEFARIVISHFIEWLRVRRFWFDLLYLVYTSCHISYDFHQTLSLLHSGSGLFVFFFGVLCENVRFFYQPFDVDDISIDVIGHNRMQFQFVGRFHMKRYSLKLHKPAKRPHKTL